MQTRSRNQGSGIWRRMRELARARVGVQRREGLTGKDRVQGSGIRGEWKALGQGGRAGLEGRAGDHPNNHGPIVGDADATVVFKAHPSEARMGHLATCPLS